MHLFYLEEEEEEEEGANSSKVKCVVLVNGFVFVPRGTIFPRGGNMQSNIIFNCCLCDTKRKPHKFFFSFTLNVTKQTPDHMGFGTLFLT